MFSFDFDSGTTVQFFVAFFQSIPKIDAKEFREWIKVVIQAYQALPKRDKRQVRDQLPPSRQQELERLVSVVSLDEVMKYDGRVAKIAEFAGGGIGARKAYKKARVASRDTGTKAVSKRAPQKRVKRVAVKRSARSLGR